jgi:hypothetical protein
MARERSDRQLKFNQDRQDLLTSIGQRQADLLTGLQSEYNLTAEQLFQIYKLYDYYYGPSGILISLLQNFYNAIGGGASSGGGGGGGNQPPPRKMAQGGMGIANTPTSVTFGDAGPEAAFFMPLNGSSMGNLPSFSNLSVGGGSGGKTIVEVRLSPDLQTRIINQAQAGIVDVIVKELA